MLSLLLDEMISAVIADQVKARRPDMSIQSIHRWRGGTLTKQPDHMVIRAASEENRTLVTYDLSTIGPLIREWVATGLTHGGVVFISYRTLPSKDFGRLIRALERFWDFECEQDWTNRSDFLRAL